MNSEIMRGWKFPIDVDKTTGRIITIEDNECLKQGMDLILRTEKSERLFNPDFGVDIRKFLFRGLDPNIIRGIEKEVTRSLNKNKDKHVIEIKVKAVPDYEKESTVLVDIEYRTDRHPERLEKMTKSVNTSELDED